MEQLRYFNGAYPPACFTCPARTFSDGGYFCDPARLDDKSVILSVARHRPDKCPNGVKTGTRETSSEILLRKLLGK